MCAVTPPLSIEVFTEAEGALSALAHDLHLAGQVVPEIVDYDADGKWAKSGVKELHAKLRAKDDDVAALAKELRALKDEVASLKQRRRLRSGR